MSADQWGRVWLECRDSFLYVPNLKRFAHKKDIGEGQVRVHGWLLSLCSPMLLLLLVNWGLGIGCGVWGLGRGGGADFVGLLRQIALSCPESCCFCCVGLLCPLSCPPPPCQVIDSLKHTFGAVQAQLAKELKKVEKAEAKLTLVTAGFEKRCASGVEALQRKAAERDEKYVVFGVCVHLSRQVGVGGLGFTRFSLGT